MDGTGSMRRSSTQNLLHPLSIPSSSTSTADHRPTCADSSSLNLARPSLGRLRSRSTTIGSCGTPVTTVVERLAGPSEPSSRRPPPSPLIASSTSSSSSDLEPASSGSSSAESSPPLTPTSFYLLPIPGLASAATRPSGWPSLAPTGARQEAIRREEEDFKTGRRRSKTLDELRDLQRGTSLKGKKGLPMFRSRPSFDSPSISPLVEPLSASTKEEDEALPRRYPLATLLPRVFALCVAFSTSFLLIAYLLSTIPGLSLPTSLPLIRRQIASLRTYSSSSWPATIHLLSVLSTVFVWKQAFSIPGSALVNVLLGSIYGTFEATSLACLLTALGSTVAYAMAKGVAPVVETFMPRPLAVTRRAMDRFVAEGDPATGARGGKRVYDTAELTSYLLLARLLPVLPYAVLNIASGVLDIPIQPFFWTLVVGSFPYNYVTTQVGDLLSEATAVGADVDVDGQDLQKLWNVSILVKLLTVSLVGVVPVLFKSRLRHLITSLHPPKPSSMAVAVAVPTVQMGQKVDEVRKEWVGNEGLGRLSDELDRTKPPSAVVVGGSVKGQGPGGEEKSVWDQAATGWAKLRRASWKRASLSAETVFGDVGSLLVGAGGRRGSSPGIGGGGVSWSPRKRRERQRSSLGGGGSALAREGYSSRRVASIIVGGAEGGKGGVGLGEDWFVGGDRASVRSGSSRSSAKR